MSFKCIIFDCDGVLVDSESITARIFQQMASELGLEIDFETAIEQFAGYSMQENMDFLEKSIKGDLPVYFEKEFRKRTYKVFLQDLKPVEGIHEFIEKVRVPFCVASSGPSEKIRLNLTITNLIDRFNGNIFSSYDIGSWKPDPEIFLFAAKEMGFTPDECIVIEDSISGIKAAKAGGFRVYALANEKKNSKFKELGATVFSSMEELHFLINFG